MDLRPFLLILLSPVVFGQTPDLTTAFQQYVDACSPNRLCPISSKVHPPLNYNVTLPSVCPPCDCDERCILRGTCCPDLLFSRKAIPSCVDVTIIGDDRRRYYMVPVCRNKDLCNYGSLDVRLKNVPVSSMATSYSYETKALAEKHENGATLLEWGVEFACNSSVDFNFISKYSKLVESVQRENCSIRYSPSGMIKVQECSTTVETISHCNRTGLWLKYDPGIDWACSNSYQHSGLFENIFCRLCNPSKASVAENDESLISVCNHTGLWQRFDKEVEDGCLSSSKSHVSYPFKNVFCWICNTGSKTIPYKEMGGYISETIEEHAYRYQLNVTGFSEEYASTLLKQMAKTNTSGNFPFMILRDGQWINKSSLVAQYQAVTGRSTCDKKIVTGCVCDSSCFEDVSKECCIDFLLNFNMDFPVSILLQNISRQVSLTISSCNMKNSFTDKCLNPSNDFLGIFPVTDLSQNLHYRNIHCYLCNTKNISNLNSVSPWNLTINSPELLDIQFYTSIMDVMNLVSHKGLEMILTPHVTTWPKRQSLGSDSGPCNKTGLWKTFDSDVSWACNSLHTPDEMYRETFCTICNPRMNVPSIRKGCNITKAWDLLDYNIKSACSVFPEVTATFPYKNQFCKYCNSPSSTYLVTTTQSPRESETNSGLNTASLRDIFGVFRGKEETTCSHLHFKTQTGDCRKQRCYPGKVLTKEGCIPLLPVTKNLNYSIHFSLSLDGNISLTTNAMEILNEEVTSIIKSILNVTNVKFHSKLKLFTSNNNITLAIGINFFVEDMIPRLKSESMMVSLRRNPTNFLQIKNVHFLEPNLTKFVFEPNISTIEIGTPSSSSQEEIIYRHVIISSLVTCKQVELFKDEIEIDIETKRIRILNSRAVVDESEYYVTENGAYAVCVDKYCADSSCSEDPTSESDLEKALRVFTIVCTIPSLLCLIATFIHYCLFKRLRTTPGIHFMSLTVSLFFSQFFFQFFLRKNFQNESSCQVMGMVIHFWWLATFCCYALNGYLMFKTFRANVDFNSSDQRISKSYFLFSYGIPLAVVLLTLITNLLSSGNTGYGTGSVCFLNNTASLIVSFLFVIGIVCICNFAFFIFVIYKLIRYKKQQQLLGINKNDMNMISIFFKLFFISGLSWIFFIIDATIPETTVFSFFVTFVNCLQGVLVFLLEVCKKKSLKMYKDFNNSRRKGRPRQSFSSSKKSVLREASRRASRSGSDGSVNPAFSSIEEDVSTATSSVM